MPGTQPDKAARFRALHEGEPFIIPNPSDAGSARVLEAFGFGALATTSSGFAFTLGAIALAAHAGAVGGSIEDYDQEEGIYEVPRAVERATAAEEIKELGAFTSLASGAQVRRWLAG